MNRSKIQGLKETIKIDLVTDFDRKIDDVLSICESQIEKLMLLNLLYYFQTYRIESYWDKRYAIEFIEEEIIYPDPDLGNKLNLLNKSKIRKFKYREVANGVYQKFIGFKITDNVSNSIIESNKIEQTFFHDFEIIPQYDVIIDEKHYRLDIAIFMHHRDLWVDEIIKTKKIGLECDGYDYHSSPEQKRNDDIRARKLKKSGWKEILRYSGKEISGLKDMKEIHYLFSEIIEILYI